MSQYQPYVYQPMMRYYYGTPHEASVAQLATWMQRASPAAYSAVISAKPHLFDAGSSVRSGLMGLNGFGAVADDNPTTPLTDWGNQLLDLAKGYMAYDTQKELMKINIARAEKGLAPISSSQFAPQLNVGVSPEVQTLGMLAIGGLVVVGLLAAFKRR